MSTGSSELYDAFAMSHGVIERGIHGEYITDPRRQRQKKEDNGG